MAKKTLGQQEDELQRKIAQRTIQNRAEREKAQQRGQQYAQSVMNRPMQGLTPEQRKAMQYEADMQVHRGMEAANRRLLGQQGKSGILGKSGVAYAQQRDLQKLGMEAQGAANRDLTKLDADLALKKLAASLALEQGEAAQSQIDRQIAADELRLADELKRQRQYSRRANKIFSRV